MPPKTNAERQKAYREKLKKEKPAKYEKIRVKHLEKIKENNKKKKEMLTEKEKEELREKWRQANAKRAERKKKANLTTHDKNTLEVRKNTYSNTKILKETLKNLIEENNQLKRRNKNLKQACNRMRKRMVNLKKLLHQQTVTNNDVISIEPTAKTPQCDDTPLTKSNSFIKEVLPNVSLVEKERVKKKLLLLNTITDSLKTEFNKADPKERTILKKVATNEIANKKKLKTAISNVLGLKGRIRTTTKGSNQMRKKYKKEIQNFFAREDVSRPSAGKKECITRNKEKVQKRYLIEPIYKLYRKYRTEGGKASLQTFYRFRPFFVVKPRLQDRNTCACIKHCNLLFKAISLKKLGLLQTSDIDELMKNVSCSNSFKCMYSECSECKDKKLAIDLTISEDSPVQWLQWKMSTYTYTKIGKKKSEEKQTKKYLKQIVKGTVTTLIKEFQDDIQKFKTHYFNVSHQYLAWKKCIENLDEEEAALICDFSENFSCKQSEEIQAVHFGGSRNQVTLHTCVLYRKNANPRSICSVSPSNEHGPGAIWAHLDPIMKLCKGFNIKNIHIFSDSPATQYRQKHNFYLFQKNIKEYKYEYATWNFFEASHGKGPADGVGGALKRQLDNHISHGNDIINAKEAYEYLLINSRVKMFYINENNIQNMMKMIPKNVIPIKGTMKIHQIVIDDNTKIKYKLLSCFDCKKNNICCDCYHTKEHELLPTNYLTGPKAVPCRNKRNALKIQNTPAKRFKRINSSTTTESDVSVRYYDDLDPRDVEFESEGDDKITDFIKNFKKVEKVDLVSDIEELTHLRFKDRETQDSDVEFENEDNDKVTDFMKNFEQEVKIDLVSDIEEITQFRFKDKETQDSWEKKTGKKREPTENEKVTTLSSSRFMSANRAFYNPENKVDKAEGLTTENEIYSTQEGKETRKYKGKGIGKKTVKHQQLIKEEKYPIDTMNVLRQIDDTEQSSKDLKSRREERSSTDLNSLPIIFFDNLVSDEVLVTNDEYKLDATIFNEPEYNLNYFDDNINIDDMIIEKDNAKENNTENENGSNESVIPIIDTHKIKRKIPGLTIIKDERLENKDTKNKVVYKSLKPLSLNNYINAPKRNNKPKSEKLRSGTSIMKQNVFNYYKDKEEIYKALKDTDSN
ncbi:uncharacterized protein LOC106134461 [Amyelois transitella]|uniref:uncharacterized protein LOC106134461 n=2 Tax=Amyelois transitella TaxID=680683 RepID=UPI00067C3464|nr:uncharacterized protein LOC106134461 [Amyelois transitella]